MLLLFSKFTQTWSNRPFASFRIQCLCCAQRLDGELATLRHKDLRHYSILCPKKVVHQSHGDNFVNNLNGFSKLFNWWKEN